MAVEAEEEALEALFLASLALVVAVEAEEEALEALFLASLAQVLEDLLPDTPSGLESDIAHFLANSALLLASLALVVALFACVVASAFKEVIVFT